MDLPLAEFEDPKLRTIVVENYTYPDRREQVFTLEFYHLLNSSCHFNFVFSPWKSSDKFKTGRLQIMFPTAKDAQHAYPSFQRSSMMGDYPMTLVDPQFFSSPESHQHCTFFKFNESHYYQSDVFILNLPRSTNVETVRKACGWDGVRWDNLVPMPSGDGPLQARVSIELEQQDVSERILARPRDVTIYDGGMEHTVKVMNVEEYKKYMKSHTEYQFTPPKAMSWITPEKEVEKIENVDNLDLRKVTVKDLQHPGGWGTAREILPFLKKCIEFSVTFSRPPGADQQQRMTGQMDLVFDTAQSARDAYKDLQHLFIDGIHPAISVHPDFFFAPDPHENGTFFELSDNPCLVYLLYVPKSIDGNMITNFFGGERPVHFKTLPMLAKENFLQAQVLLADRHVTEKILKGSRHFTLAHNTQKDLVMLLSLDEYNEYTGTIQPTKEITNWCHLPMEMRLECIRLLDFESKMLLRRTSRTEKRLVECEKHNIWHVYIEYDEDNWKICSWNMTRWNGFRPKQMYAETRDNMDISLLSSLLKYGSVKSIEVQGVEQDASSFFGEVLKEGKLNAAELEFYQVADVNVFKLLEHYAPESAYNFDFKSISRTLLPSLCADPVLKPVLLGATYLKCEARSRVPINAIVDWWIENDVPVKTELSVDMRKSDFEDEADEEVDDPLYRLLVVRNFCVDYQHRTIDDNERMFRIRTDNDEKHIIFYYRDNGNQFVWRVIPSNFSWPPQEAQNDWDI